MHAILLLFFLTDDLQAAVVMDLPDVSGAEPPLAVPVHGEILLLLVFALVVSHRDIGAADQNLPSGIWPVHAVVSTLKYKTNKSILSALCFFLLKEKNASIFILVCIFQIVSK